MRISLLAAGAIASTIGFVGCGDFHTQIVLKDGRKITPKFVLAQGGTWSFTESTIPGDPKASRLIERSDRILKTYKMESSEEAGLQYTLTSYDKKLDDGAQYSKYILSVKNVSDQAIDVDRIYAIKDIPVKGDSWTISGNTDGSVAIAHDEKSTLFFAIEHPMAKMKIEAASDAWSWNAQKVRAGSMEIPFDGPAGTLTLTFNYTRGQHRVDIAKVEIVDTTVVDEHHGFSGNAKKDNVYTLENVPAGPKTLRVTFAKEEGNRDALNSEGKIVLAGTAKPVENADKLASAWVDIADAVQPGEVITVSAVIGSVEDPTQLRRDFQAYLELERAHPYRFFPHYNSWYDVCINRNDAPWEKRMNEAECMAVMKAFRKELSSRGVHIDSYLWDDGWDNWDSLWDFHPGFPNGFAELAKEAHKDGASISTWMSPCGGYGGSCARRVAYAKQNGIIDKNDGLLRMSKPVYYKAFRDRVISMIKDYDMNMFKFDRMGSGYDATGASPQHAADLRAIVKLIGEMRAAKSDVFVNATVGTWASPFWTLWADSIWRGGNDWEGLGPGPQRERWITYRDNKIYDRFAQPCPLFPLNSIMMHGIIVGEKGPPACMDRSDTPASTRAFANEVWMGIGCGTGLQEYYITPRLMHKDWWDTLASAIRWARDNEATLRDVHWIGKDPQDSKGNYNIYGYASTSEKEGIVVLRNPSDKPNQITFTLDQLLEMPAEKLNSRVQSLKVAYVSDGKKPEALAKLTNTGREVQMELEPFAVVVFKVSF